MSKIKVMSENLANKIAAGEVIERISSVVKELVENAIDAKSANIKVELEDAGKKMIRVIDDGIGMDESDAQNCFSRHATSKIYKDDDLFFINTLGFRGEALPSIAAVSEVILETYDGNSGHMVHIKGGEIVDSGIAPSRKGTIFTVTNLFYNTPARLKYLKSEPAEFAGVVQFIEKLALSYPEVSFTLSNNGLSSVRTSGSGVLLKTIHEIYGMEISSNMIEIKVSSDDYDISGYISKPIIQRSTRNFMNTIVNGRIVKNLELNRIINDAYHTYKPDNTYPVVVLKIETDPTLIDVNIHPTKQDIKFSKMAELRDVLTEAIKKALYDTLLIPEAILKSPKDVEEETFEDDSTIESKLPKTLFVSEEETLRYEPLATIDSTLYDKLSEQKEMDFAKEKNALVKKLELYPVGIAFGTYIIAENKEGLFLIDQHAAVERINYEDVLRGLLTHNTVDMLIPITIELSSSEMVAIQNKMGVLTDMGFVLEEFGINTFKVRSHPAWIKEGFEEATIKTIIDIVIAEDDFDEVKFNDKVAATVACKKSLKGNTRITLDLARVILENLVKCDNPYNCPHGRPTIVKFTTYELEKMFKRAM